MSNTNDIIHDTLMKYEQQHHCQQHQQNSADNNVEDEYDGNNENILLNRTINQSCSTHSVGSSSSSSPVLITSTTAAKYTNPITPYYPDDIQEKEAEGLAERAVAGNDNNLIKEHPPTLETFPLMANITTVPSKMPDELPPLPPPEAATIAAESATPPSSLHYDNNNFISGNDTNFPINHDNDQSNKKDDVNIIREYNEREEIIIESQETALPPIKKKKKKKINKTTAPTDVTATTSITTMNKKKKKKMSDTSAPTSDVTTTAVTTDKKKKDDTATSTLSNNENSSSTGISTTAAKPKKIKTKKGKSTTKLTENKKSSKVNKKKDGIMYNGEDDNDNHDDDVDGQTDECTFFGIGGRGKDDKSNKNAIQAVYNDSGKSSKDTKKRKEKNSNDKLVRSRNYGRNTRDEENGINKSRPKKKKTTVANATSLISSNKATTTATKAKGKKKRDTSISSTITTKKIKKKKKSTTKSKESLSSKKSKNYKSLRPSRGKAMLSFLQRSSSTLGIIQRPNNGQLNSAQGEGTTIPQLLYKIRMLTFLHVLAVFTFEGFAIAGHIITFNASRIVISMYLLFFVGLLCCFELVRGTPTIEVHREWSRLRAGSFRGLLLGGNKNNNGDIENNIANLNNIDEGIAVASDAVNAAVETVWKTVVEQKQARRIRFFLQDNFGILYSCIGRGFYSCLLGGLAVGEGFIFMELTGYSFVLMGIWMISLRFRYPSLDKSFVMDFSLDEEFGGKRSGGSRGKVGVYNNEDDGIGVTWSSITGGVGEPQGERQRLIVPKMV